MSQVLDRIWLHTCNNLAVLFWDSSSIVFEATRLADCRQGQVWDMIKLQGLG